MSHSVLTPLQRKVLHTLFEKGLGERGYVLTGGTALAEFYLGHRYSDDLDFFSSGEVPATQIYEFVDNALAQADLAVERQWATQSPAESFLPLLVTAANDPGPLVLHFSSHNPPALAPPLDASPVRVDSLEDIAVNKVCTVLGRLEVKDFFDVYSVLVECDWPLDYLIARAAAKEALFDDPDSALIFAGCLRRVEELPEAFSKLRLMRPVSFEHVRRRLMQEAEALVLRQRPQSSG